jgi:hypothetical protein
MTINVEEKFIAVGIKTVDSKNRINLGEKVLKAISSKSKADAYKVFVGKDGDILLKPVVVVPSREAWIYDNPKVLKQIRDGLSEASEGKVEKVKDLDKFFKEL